MLKPHIARAFIAALRSGEYEQTRCTLRNTYKSNCFCASGLLCHVIDPHRWDGYYYKFPYSIKEAYQIPREITKAIGLDFPLIAWNDRDKLTFAQIADRVEEIHKEIL